MLVKIFFDVDGYSIEALQEAGLEVGMPDVYEVPTFPHDLYIKDQNGDVHPATKDEIKIYIAERIGLDDTKEEKKREIKAACRREILKTYPISKQLNLIRTGGQEKEDMSQWIDDFRNQSDTMEVEIDALSDPKDVAQYSITWTEPF